MHCRHGCMLQTVQGKEGASPRRMTGDEMEAHRRVGATEVMKQAAALRIPISRHVHVMSHQQQSLQVGSRLRAVEGQVV